MRLRFGTTFGQSQLPPCMENAVMILGFALASYSVVGNDVIQTLGTFLTSNHEKPWWVLFLFAGGILGLTLCLGYFGLVTPMGMDNLLGGNDVAFGRLDKINIPENLSFWYLMPPLVLLFITRFGIPVSTTFLILTFFSAESFTGMLNKSLFGYFIAFVFAWVMFYLMSSVLEKKFQERPIGSDKSLWTNRTFWTVAQWFSTAFLWSQWLTQDLANIYIYLGRPQDLSLPMFLLSLVIVMSMLAYIFYQKGGAIQGIVKAKINTDDIRSATFIDVFYGICLLVFKQNLMGLWEAKLPMSTTWVFLGLLAGREIAIRMRIGPKPDRNLSLMLFSDLGKAAMGLVVSVVLVVVLYTALGRDVMELFSFQN